jgi:hypothetical protein
MSELELHDRVIARWRARLLQHGPESDLGREARRQLIKLEAERIRMVGRQQPPQSFDLPDGLTTDLELNRKHQP